MCSERSFYATAIAFQFPMTRLKQSGPPGMQAPEPQPREGIALHAALLSGHGDAWE